MATDTNLLARTAAPRNSGGTRELAARCVMAGKMRSFVRAQAQPALRKGCHSSNGSRITIEICLAVDQRGRLGSFRSFMPASTGVRRPFFRLHDRHEMTRLVQES